jgi:hypothetical protein
VIIFEKGLWYPWAVDEKGWCKSFQVGIAQAPPNPSALSCYTTLLLVTSKSSKAVFVQLKGIAADLGLERVRSADTGTGLLIWANPVSCLGFKVDE